MATTLELQAGKANENSTSHNLLWLVVPVGLFLAVHFLLRLLISPSLHADDADLVIFDQSLALGYSEQPPLYTWLQRILTLVFGVNLFSLTLLRTLLLAGTAGLLYRGVFLITSNCQLARLATFGMLLIPLMAWHALTYLTHSILLSFFCVWTFTCLVQIAQRHAWIDYLAFGAIAGLGMLSKYNYIFFFAAITTSALLIPQFRRSLLRWPTLVSFLIACAVVTPHLFWMLEHGKKLVSAYSSKSGVQGNAELFGVIPWGAVELVKNMFLLGIIIVALVGIIFPQLLKKNEARKSESQIYVRWLILFFVALGGYHLAFVLFTHSSRLHERWLEPYYVLLPALLFIHLNGIALTKTQLFRYAIILWIFVAGLTGARVGQMVLGSAHRGYNPVDSDFANVASTLAKKIDTETAIITQERGIGGNLHLYLQNTPTVCTDHFGYRVPGHEKAKRFLLVWDTQWGKGMPQCLIDYTTEILGSPLPSDLHPEYVDLPPIVPGRMSTGLGFVVITRQNQGTLADRGQSK